jgi:hypothetical protein
MTKSVVLFNLDKNVYLIGISEVAVSPNWKKAFQFSDEEDAMTVLKHMHGITPLTNWCTRTFYKI